MTGLFRKLRKYFLSQGKTRQYLTYGLGEILLVTIGILIAIQINGIYEDNADRKKEKEYLEAYRADLLNNLVELDRVICKSEGTLQSMDSILKWSQIGPPKTVDGMVEGTIIKVGFYTIFSSSDGTIEDILGSADVKIITEDKLRQSIVSWESNLKQVKEWQRLGEGSAQDGMTYLMQHTPLYKNTLNKAFLNKELVDKLLSDQYFLNIADNQGTVAFSLIDYYKEIQANHWTLIEIIDKNLTNE